MCGDGGVCISHNGMRVATRQTTVSKFQGGHVLTSHKKKFLKISNKLKEKEW